jgi:hypothetical protein
MYGPYVRDTSRPRKHGSTILDVYLDPASRKRRIPRILWIVPVTIAIAGLAGWIATLPLGR